MNILEIIKKNLIGEKFIVNKNFIQYESFDVGTILRIDYCSYDYDESYSVKVSILQEDFSYNFEIARCSWYDNLYNPTQNIYQALFKDNFQGDLLIKPIEQVIFVMSYDDCFDLELSSYRDKQLKELGI